MILTALSAKSGDIQNPESGKRTRLLGRHHDWFVGGLYKNELRRTWSMGLLFAIVLFFALPVANLMNFTSSVGYYTEHPDQVVSFLSAYFSGKNPFVTIFAALSGIFCAVTAAEYLFDRRKTNFICSLPVKRQAYLITKAAAGLTWSVLAWIPGIVLMWIAALVSDLMRPHFALIAGGCAVLFGVWLCLQMYFFGITLLACCFCGTSVMSGCMLVVLTGYASAAVLSLIGLVEMALSNFTTDYYVTESFFSSISGVFRIFARTAELKSVWFLLGCVGLGLLFCAAAVVLTVLRHSEKAGTPFAFDRVRDIVKGLLVGLFALLGGMLFFAMSSGGAGGIVWLLFGCVCGGVLCWMLCNTIFYKTPKMMFTGRRGVALLTAVIMVFSICIQLDVFNLNNYIPSTTMTKSITLELGETTLEINDASLIRIYNAVAKNGELLKKRHLVSYYSNPVDEKAWRDETGEEVTHLQHLGDVVWHTRYLLPIAKVGYAQYSDWAEFVEALTSRDNFADLYFAEITKRLEKTAQQDPDRTSYVSFHTNSSGLQDFAYGGGIHLTAEQILSILDVYREEMRSFGGDAMQQMICGTLELSTNDGYYTLPLFDSYSKTEAAIISVFESEGAVESYTYDYTFRSAEVYYRGKVIATLDEAEWEALYAAECLTGEYDMYHSGATLTLRDMDYAVRVNYQVRETASTYKDDMDYELYESVPSDTEMAEVEGEPVEEDITSEEDYSVHSYEKTITAGFLWGCVPQEYLAMTDK